MRKTKFDDGGRNGAQQAHFSGLECYLLQHRWKSLRVTSRTCCRSNSRMELWKPRKKENLQRKPARRDVTRPGWQLQLRPRLDYSERGQWR